ncbi:MAG: glyceraldehyde 3-phosphate dehydrogenase NAD-binding domain-containing protein [Gemmatimonadales bacterium]|jgi:glyceraldehyde 3-phosphate dehydrogenase
MQEGYRVAINGLGCLGRLVLRQLLEQQSSLEVVAVNDVAPTGELVELFNHDPLYGEPTATMRAVEDALEFNGLQIARRSIADPAQLPWLDLDVDIVIEASGAFTRYESAVRHLDAGAERVVVTSARHGDDPALCVGVNEDEFYPELHRIVFCAGSTTHCVAPASKVLDENVGIESATFTVLRSDARQRPPGDSPVPVLRRDSAVTTSQAPITRDVAENVTDILPDLSGKLDGLEIRVPTGCGSIVDFVIQSEQPTTRKRVNDALRAATKLPELKNVLVVHDGDWVHSAICGKPYSALIELSSTRVTRGHTVKIVARYDPDWAFASRVADLTEHVAATVVRHRSQTRGQVIQAGP